MKCSSCGSVLADGASACQACGTSVPGLPRTQVSGRAATGSSAASQRNLRPLSNREEKAVVPVRVGDVLIGRYRLEEKIGEGGMGSVYVAHDQELERHVAVKVLAANLVTDDEVVERFEREARLNAKLDHPNIAPVYDVGRHEGRPFIVMKLLEGDTLAGLLRTKGGLSSDETLKLMRQLAAGLDYIHGKGFIHRDIKAGNIFVGPTGHATILDFGILRPKSAAQGLTRTGMVMGTPHYMAPEQALGLRDVDHRVDIYALAVVLFECLTGTLPFEADSELRLIQLQAHAPPPDILQRAPWIARPVADVMRRALAKRPDDRFNSGAELVKALEAAYRDSGGHAAAPPQQANEGTAPGWRMKAGLLDALRQKDAAQSEAERQAGALATPGAHAGVPSGGASGGGTSGAVAGGVASGGVAGGVASGGVASGGVAGGVASGGVASGGVASGGVASGGVASSGVASGGVASGGVASGGVASGGVASGGVASGGVVAGVASGGVAGGVVGGVASAGVASAGVASGGVASGGVASGGVASAGVASGGVASAGVASGGVASAGVASAGVASAGVASAAASSGTPVFPTAAQPFDGARPPSRRGVTSLVAVAALLLVAAIAWKLWPAPVDVTASPDAGASVATAPDAGATSPLVQADDAGADAADAGAALAVTDAPDAGDDTPLDAGTQVAVIDKHPPGKRNGRLNVVTTHEGEPWWASVSIDGVPRGRTPLLLDLPVGRYQLRVERAGFRTEQREIKVASGKSTVLRIDLVP